MKKGSKKNLPVHAGVQEIRVQSLGQERSPVEGNGNPLQCSYLENCMDIGAWWATVHGLQKWGHNPSNCTHTHFTSDTMLYLR